ncbi:MAG TPA: RNA chaperone Hfq [Alphaproteobacteria bacterium]|nr:RNA chaperone Hfq [Alphaproteobacteria bacterium]
MAANAKTSGKPLFESFIAHLVKGHSPVTVFLTNGVKLSGSITWNDPDCLTLTRDGVTQLVMRHAVATIMPQDAFQVFDVMGE